MKSRIRDGIEKNKILVLILAVGILLMCIPERKTAEETKAPEQPECQQPRISEELTEILSKIDGVGKVQVMLTESSGAETIYQTDDDRTNSDGSSTIHLETVTVSNDGTESGLIRSVTPPVYLGAIVVCQGGDNPVVRLQITQAVSSVTGIGTDRITVLKMK